MKRFKFGIAALVAILAMSFTVASHEGAFKTKQLNSKLSYTCTTTTNDVGSFWYCKAGVRTQVTSSTAPSNIPAVGTCTFTDAAASTGLACDETQNFFCCFTPTQGKCTKPTCALVTDVAGFPVGTIHYKSN